jgi:hypothetical protein
LLITDVFRKQVQDGLSTAEYLQVFINRITKNNRESVMASKSSRASKTASKIGSVSKKLRQSQQRLSQRISLIGNLPVPVPSTPEPGIQEEEPAPVPLPKDDFSKIEHPPSMISPSDPQKKKEIKNIFKSTVSQPNVMEKEENKWETKKTDSIDQFLKDLESRRATPSLLKSSVTNTNAREVEPVAKDPSSSPIAPRMIIQQIAPPAPIQALIKNENDVVSKSRLSLLQSSLTDFMKDQRSSTYLEDQFGKDSAVDNNPSTLTAGDKDGTLTSRFAPQVQPILSKPLSKEELVKSSPLVTAPGQDTIGRLRTPDERLASERLLYADLSAEILETLEVLQMMGKNLDGLFLQVGSVYGMRNDSSEEAGPVSAS